MEIEIPDKKKDSGLTLPVSDYAAMEAAEEDQQLMDDLARFVEQNDKDISDFSEPKRIIDKLAILVR